MRRSFNVIDIVEVLEHWYAGRPKAQVSASLGLDRKTVRKYVRRAEEAGFVPGGAPVMTETWAVLVRQWFPELVVPGLRSKAFAICEPHRETIGEMLKTNHLSTVHQRLRDEAGLATSESTLRRYVALRLPDELKAERATPLRDDPAPGEEGQVDYGRLGMVFDPETSRRRALWAFLFVLACSRHLFVRPTFVMDQVEWVAAHVAAAEFFGGLPTRIVLDNLADGVLRADIYDPKLNRTYGEWAHHYGVLIDPARRAKPKDKARCERMVPYVRESLFKGREQPDLRGWRAEAKRWSTDVAGARHCRALEGAPPYTVFLAAEQDALVPLPPAPFELSRWSSAKVHDDCHIKVGKTLYSVPWRHIGDRVEARATSTTVAIYAKGELVKTHVVKPKGRQTDYGDYPPDKVAFFQRTPTWCRRRAGEVGPGCAAVVAELLEVNVLHRLRSAQGILSLADRYGPERLEAACAKAAEVGDPSYRTVKGLLLAGAETRAAPEPTGADTPALLHGPGAFDEDEAAS
ncbi:MAG TPA: IS21 family transposase [Acidimicrobiales bacterium]|nr:IS21 family transposase [Acidimicrobiales bacterium]